MLPTRVLRSAFWGMIAWQAYGVIEFSAATLAPLLQYKNMVIATWSWKLTLLLFAFYTLAGLAVGALTGLILGPVKKIGDGQLKAASTLTLILAFLANLSVGAHQTPILMASIPLAAVVTCGVLSDAWNRRFSWAVDPWPAALFLMVSAWAVHDGLGRLPAAARSVSGFLLALAFVGASTLMARIGRPRAKAVRLLRQASTPVGGMALALACGVLLNAVAQAQLAAGRPAAAAGAKPNVLLITLDTVRADHMSLYGYERHTTPNLERLAETASVFTHAQAASNTTPTSHAAIFTGVYGSWNGSHYTAHQEAPPISKQYPVIPQILSQHGYFTGAAVANTLFLQPNFGFGRGVQFYSFKTAIGMIPPGKPYYLRRRVREVLARFMSTAEFDMLIRRAAEINRDAFDFLNLAGASGRPFFLFLNYMDAHSLYTPPPPFDSRYPGKDWSITNADYLRLKNGVPALKFDMPDHERRHLISQYDGAIAYLDDRIASLLQRLKKLGLYDNTLIIVTADHGESFGERRLVGHGLSAYEGEVHVPLIVKYPGNSTKQVIDVPVGHTDILPTIMDVAGIGPPAFVQGRSLRDAAADAAANRPVVSESFPSHANIHMNRSFDRTERAIYWENYKYVGSSAGQRELYNLTADPAETSDLCAVEPTRCNAMRSALELWASGIPKETTSPAKRADPQALERLRSLGYVQ